MKMNKKLSTIAFSPQIRIASAGLILLTPCLLTSCGGNDNSNEVSSLRAELDSVKNKAAKDKAEYEDLQLFVNTISTSLDSIAFEEDMLFGVVDPEKKPTTREQIRQRIEDFGSLIERQQNIINRMADSLRTKGSNAPQLEKLNNIVAYLNKQLQSKDLEIRNIKAQLNNKNRSITQLQKSIKNLEENVTTLEHKNAVLDQVATTQDEVINECYIKIGNGKELEKAGILKGGGFLRKKKLDYSSFQNAGFQKVDIRHCREINIPAKKFDILTGVPSGSYEVIKNANGTSTLRILDANSFWSVSNYLVIKTK